MSALDRLRGLFRPKAAPSANGKSLPDQSLWDQFKRIGGSLTPQQVSAIIRQADGGNMQPLVDLANDSRQKDCTLQSVLGTREKAVAGLDWQLIFPGQDKDSSREPRQKKLVESVLRDNESFPAVIEHLAGAGYYGHAVVENLWGRDSKDRLIIKTFKTQSARRFGYRPVDGEFVWEDRGAVTMGVPLSSFPLGNFAISHPRITGDVPCREGLARVLMWAALFRNWTLSDWLKLGEIGWKPWRTGIYKKTASTEDIANLVEILEGMSSSGVAVHPDSTEVKVEWPKGQGAQASHSELFDKIGAEMAKAVLGQTLTSDQGRVGSQALGNVHNEVRKDLLEADAKHIASVITRDIVTPLVRLNFGDNVEVPRFKFVTEEKADLGTFATGISVLVASGLRIPANWVRDQAGIPHPEADEEIVGVSDDDAEEEDPEADPAEEADPEEDAAEED